MNAPEVPFSGARLWRRLFHAEVDAPLTPAQVLLQEERHLTGRGALSSSSEPAVTLPTVISQLHQRDRTALCLSGGGIRSASFAVGAMQSLASIGLLTKFDYLSTVSGGGYAGSWLSAWLVHHQRRGSSVPSGAPGDEASVESQLTRAGQNGGPPEPEPLRHLRECSRYLDPRPGVFSADVWTLVATVARNLLANWFILLPLVAATLLVPRFYHSLLDLGAQEFPGLYGDSFQRLLAALFWIVVLLTILSLGYVVADLPGLGRRSHGQKPFLVWCLGPATTAAALLLIYRGWNRELTAAPYPLPTLIAIGAVVHVGIWMVGGRRPWFRPRTWLGAACASALAALGLWWVEWLFPNPLQVSWLYTASALPLVLTAIGGAGAVFVAMASNETADEDREWWARAGAWLLIVSAGWLGVGIVVFEGPQVMQWCAEAMGKLRISEGSAKSLLGLLTAAAGGIAANSIGPGAGKRPSRFRRALFAAAAPTFVVLALTVLSWMNLALLKRAESAAFLDWLHVYMHPPGTGLFEIIGLAATFAGLGVGMGFLVNVNKFSLHGMYRNRLIRTFLGASRADRRPNPFTGFDPDDNLKMYELAVNQRPLHVINAALNLVSANKLAWQDRKAESFTITPLHCGSNGVGYRPSREYGKGISLGGAMTISGAAVSPNQGPQSSPALTFLLTLFNARLGAWLGNPGRAGADTWRYDNPRIGPRPLVDELFGRTTDTNPYIYVSDGGHFDNLGLYEMVLRRCRHIVVCDAGCDPDYGFEDLGNALRKIRVDFGIPITFNRHDVPVPMPMNRAGQGKTNAHCTLATIDYVAADGPEARPGLLLYVKATLSGDEPIDVVSYGEAVPAFPHESTVDQWFGELQFESYRMLGRHSIDTLRTHLSEPPRGGVWAVPHLFEAAGAYLDDVRGR